MSSHFQLTKCYGVQTIPASENYCKLLSSVLRVQVQAEERKVWEDFLPIAGRDVFPDLLVL